MEISQAELFGVLRQYNPWWGGGRPSDLPKWRRAAFREIRQWLDEPPGNRALLLSGARQVGKTTLFLQAIAGLLEAGVPPGDILYVTFDHPLIKLLGPDALLRLWREYEPAGSGPEYLFLDEIQSIKDWPVWLKHQVDFNRKRRIAVTGSALSLAADRGESGVGRWLTVRLATMSFFEYLQILEITPPDLPAVSSLLELFTWDGPQFARCGESARPLVGLFHDYLLRGGFPQSAMTTSLPMAQRLLREDIVDKVLKRDMTAFFGVRRVLELEQVFLYLCLHDGGILDLPDLCDSLQLKRPTVGNFISLLEETHLIYRLLPFGYGKQVLRGKPKIYLSDPAVASGVLLKGREMLEDGERLGRAVETAVFKHLFTRYYNRAIGFSYWRGKKEHEVDIVADLQTRLVPFEVKYRMPAHTRLGESKGLVEFCRTHSVPHGYLITRDPADFGPPVNAPALPQTRLMKIPAALFCYWLGRSELEGVGLLDP